MIDNTQDSLDFTDWIWGYPLNLSSIIIPKHLVAATRGNTTLLFAKANSLSGGLLRNNMQFVFPKSNDNLLIEKHTQRLASSLLMVSCSSLLACAITHHSHVHSIVLSSHARVSSSRTMRPLIPSGGR